VRGAEVEGMLDEQGKVIEEGMLHTSLSKMHCSLEMIEKSSMI
jgi:hypothetical protein